VPIGFAMMIEMGSSNTLIQSMVPDGLRGRVMSVYSMMFMGMAPIGSLLSGWVADRLGAPFTVAAGGAICMVAAGLFWRRWPDIRVDARRLIVAQQMAGGDLPQGMTGGGLEIESTSE
jgi:MFS family permease